MKRINYLFLSLLFYTITFSAQDYDPVIKDGSFWDVSADHNGCAFVKRIIISNDTLINNKVYKKTFTAPIRDQYGTSCISPPLHINENEFESSPFLREDINEKKLYILAYPPDTYSGELQEYVLCDFNLEVNDVLENTYNLSTDTPEVIISQITIDSDNRKIFYTNIGQSYKEGIGKLDGHFRPYGSDLVLGSERPNYDIYCYGDTQNQNNCTPVLATEKYNLSKTEIYPNPTANTISLKNVPLDSKIRIVTILGKQIDSFILKQKTIDISNYKKGIYFIEITTSNNSKKLLKLIKK